MELCFMKSNALDTLKNGLPQIFDKYLTEGENSWLVEVCGENPFVKFRDVPDFELVSLDDGLSAGELDFRNCKILYKHLNFLTPRQAADERFWAGLCHGVFYDYVRRRWSYDKIDDLSTVNVQETIKKLTNRFFFDGGSREKLLTNTLSKYWWAGHIFDAEALDSLGANDFYTKIFSIVSRSFIGNKNLRKGFVQFLKYFKDRGVMLNTDKHIRPAMVELNMVGGAVILDCLTADEVAEILIAHVEKILQRKRSEPIETSAPKETVKPAPKVDDTRTTVTVDKTVKPPPKIDDTPKVDDTRTVQFGNTVKVVSLDNGRQRTYKITAKFKKQFIDIHDELVGKQINSVVTIRDDKFTITDIQ